MLQQLLANLIYNMQTLTITETVTNLVCLTLLKDQITQDDINMYCQSITPSDNNLCSVVVADEQGNILSSLTLFLPIPDPNQENS